MSDWEKTGYIPVDEGFCDFRACENHYYLTACGKLLTGRWRFNNGKCPACKKPLMVVENTCTKED